MWLFFSSFLNFLDWFIGFRHNDRRFFDRVFFTALAYSTFVFICRVFLNFGLTLFLRKFAFIYQFWAFLRCLRFVYLTMIYIKGLLVLLHFLRSRFFTWSFNYDWVHLLKIFLFLRWLFLGGFILVNTFMVGNVLLFILFGLFFFLEFFKIHDFDGNFRILLEFSFHLIFS